MSDFFEKMDLINDEYLEEALENEAVWNDDDTVDAPGKNRTRKKIRGWQYKAVAIAASVVLLFVGLVNLFPETALAMNDVLLLGDLAKAVTFDKSMKACLENEYAQYVGKQQITETGQFSKVYYMVVDASRISIFFKTDVPGFTGEEGNKSFAVGEVKDLNGKDISGSGSIHQTDIKHLYEFRMDFGEEKEREPMPEGISFMIEYFDRDENGDIIDIDKPFSKAEYHLYPDTKYSKVQKTYDVNQEIEIEGQKFNIERLEVYPTQAMLCIEADKENSDLLWGATILLQDDKGRTYSERMSGTNGTFDVESDNLRTKWYESSYFNETKEITAVITDVFLKSKEERYGKISYANKSIEHMPEGVQISEMTLNDDGSLSVSIKARKQGECWYPCIESFSYRDAEGIIYDFPEYASQTIYTDDEEHAVTTFTIPNFKEDNFYIEWIYPEFEKLEKPIEVKVK